MREFPRANPEGTLKGEGLYLTLYPKSSTNMNSIEIFLKIHDKFMYCPLS